jgi:FKBP-type peptidyl-prolyl cis-trans isomerase 2
MAQAKHGNTVKVHYTGTLGDGTEFDSSRGGEPLSFTLGEGNIIPGFERAVEGMETGETRTVTISAEQAYGERRDELVQDLPRTAIPDDIELSRGLVLHAEGPGGETLVFTVAAFDEATVTVDGNHPLAGRDLTFALELVEVD